MTRPWWRTRPRLIVLLAAAARGETELQASDFDERVVRWAVDTGFGPLLRRALAHDPAAATSAVWPLLLGADLSARVVTGQNLDAMTEIIDACHGRVPPLVLLKGISVCAQYYPEPHLRPMRDIDILTDGDAIPAVESFLRRLGYHRRTHRPADFYATHHHGCPFLNPRTGVWVEVHRALFPSRSELAAEAVFAPGTIRRQLRASQFRGRPVSRLSPELQIVYLSCHWAREHRLVGGMVPMADLVFLLKRAPAVRWEEIARTVHGSVAARYLHLLLTYCDKHQLLDIPPEVIASLVSRHTLGRMALEVVHSLIDHYLADGREFGRVVSKRTFNRLWNVLVLRRPRLARS